MFNCELIMSPGVKEVFNIGLSTNKKLLKTTYCLYSTCNKDGFHYSEAKK